MQELAIEELKGNADKIRNEFGAEVVVYVFTANGAIVHGTTRNSIQRTMSINFDGAHAGAAENSDSDDSGESGEGGESGEACAPRHRLTRRSP